MPNLPVSFDKPTNEIFSSGNVVGITDRIYSIEGTTVTFREILVKGDLSGELTYNGVKIKITRINTIIGLEIGEQGPRGPVWKSVECVVIK